MADIMRVGCRSPGIKLERYGGSKQSQARRLCCETGMAESVSSGVGVFGRFLLTLLRYTKRVGGNMQRLSENE